MRVLPVLFASLLATSAQARVSLSETLCLVPGQTALSEENKAILVHLASRAQSIPTAYVALFVSGKAEPGVSGREVLVGQRASAIAAQLAVLGLRPTTSHPIVELVGLSLLGQCSAENEPIELNLIFNEPK